MSLMLISSDKSFYIMKFHCTFFLFKRKSPSMSPGFNLATKNKDQCLFQDFPGLFWSFSRAFIFYMQCLEKVFVLMDKVSLRPFCMQKYFLPCQVNFKAGLSRTTTENQDSQGLSKTVLTQRGDIRDDVIPHSLLFVSCLLECREQFFLH